MQFPEYLNRKKTATAIRAKKKRMDDGRSHQAATNLTKRTLPKMNAGKKKDWQILAYSFILVNHNQTFKNSTISSCFWSIAFIIYTFFSLVFWRIIFAIYSTNECLMFFLSQHPGNSTSFVKIFFSIYSTWYRWCRWLW